MTFKRSLKIANIQIPLGKTMDVLIPISETYMGTTVSLPTRVIRAKKTGPTIFVSGAVHGDELTGVGVIRDLMFKPLDLLRGTLILIPVTNIFGFENHSRYLPDRRDLNRCFPGLEKGNLGLRLAHAIFHEIIMQCDYGIDMHSAAVRRTNFPQVRADLRNKELAKIAEAFGCEVIMDNEGPVGSLRREACENGCPTLIYEAGEALKFQQGSIEIGVRGVKNVLRFLNMISGEIEKPAYQSCIKKSQWIRSNDGGLLQFFVSPGDRVEKGDRIAACQKILIEETEAITSLHEGVILGMTTLPAVKPGQPIYHIGKAQAPNERLIKKRDEQNNLHRKAQIQLGSGLKTRRVLKKEKQNRRLKK